MYCFIDVIAFFQQISQATIMHKNGTRANNKYKNIYIKNCLDFIWEYFTYNQIYLQYNVLSIKFVFLFVF